MATALIPSGRSAFVKLPADPRKRAIPGYFHAAVLIGAYYILAQTSLVASVGIAIHTVAVVTGQTVSGLAVDRIGLGPGGKRAITAVRFLGVFLTVCAVFLAVSPRIAASSDAVDMLVLLGLVALAGVLMTFHTPSTAGVPRKSGRPYRGR